MLRLLNKAASLVLAAVKALSWSVAGLIVAFYCLLAILLGLFAIYSFWWLVFMVLADDGTGHPSATGELWAERLMYITLGLALTAGLASLVKELTNRQD